MQVGFVGLGLMGLAMARNVIKGGHSVCGYDLQGRALRVDGDPLPVDRYDTERVEIF